MRFVGTKPQSKTIPADYTIIGYPLSLTATYRGGTDQGPSAIRKASDSIESYSPVTDRDLEDYNIVDVGDMEIGPDMESNLSNLEKYLLETTSPVAILGGEHTLTIASTKAFLKKYPDLMLVVLDAHTDLREEYEGKKISHATWLKQVIEFMDPSRVVLSGVRSGTQEEFQAPLLEMREDTEISELATGALMKAKAVYLSIDIDVLDCPYVPGCGNPEPGGLHYKELEELIIWLGLSTNLIGFDLVEVAPQYDCSEITAITAARIVRETILASIKK